MNISKEKIALALKTGKTINGGKKVAKQLLTQNIGLILIAKNAPTQLREQLTYYARLAQTPCIITPHTSLELAGLARRNHPVSAIGIIDGGDSDIMANLEKK